MTVFADGSGIDEPRDFPLHRRGHVDDYPDMAFAPACLGRGLGALRQVRASDDRSEPDGRRPAILAERAEDGVSVRDDLCGADEMNTQPQLLHVPLVEKDVVYTPDAMACEIVDFFKPTGKILEPCKGDGAFMRYLPFFTEWCEIAEGKDFFLWNTPVDWIVGNPPYSIFNIWLRHSFEIANDIVYLIPLNKIFNDYGMLKDIYRYGGVKQIYVIGRGEKANFPMGYAVGAVHFQRDYIGGMSLFFTESL